ncbi:MAG TPA: ATP-binding protein [Chloroflexia bacterium]|nr:ATP-binding protein [Chloroflexia bacterium]
MLDLLYHTFNFTISGCYFIIFLLIFSGLLHEKAFGRNELGTATSGIFLTCSLGHLVHAATTHASGAAWEVGLQVIVDGWTVLPAIVYLILRRKYGLLIRGPDMINEFRVQIARQQAEIKLMREFEKLKDDFLAMASHELRTPLTTIKGYAQILSKNIEKFSDPKMGVAVRAINQQSDRMAKLINQLLDVSRIQNHKLQIQPVALNLNPFMTALVSRLQITSPNHELQVSVKNEPLWVKVDEDLLEQVISNLVSNATKYSPDNEPVEITIDQAGPNAVIKVRDHGNGIALEEQPKIFDRFYRSPQVKNSTKEGLGLGLFITSELVKASGGEISVESAPGKGSIFTVLLPAIPAPSKMAEVVLESQS